MTTVPYPEFELVGPPCPVEGCDGVMVQHSSLAWPPEVWTACSICGAETLRKQLIPASELDLDAVPARTELTFLPADPPRPPLNFSVREYMGMHLEDAAGNLLGQDQDLQAGAEVYCNGVKLILTSPSQAKSAASDWLYFIQRGGDDRNCWVCNGVANTRALIKLEMTK